MKTEFESRLQYRQVAKFYCLLRLSNTDKTRLDLECKPHLEEIQNSQKAQSNSYKLPLKYDNQPQTQKHLMRQRLSAKQLLNYHQKNLQI
ncbi:MAG: hypothetical protein EB116_17440 [Betaproteobacteria bacterium]|nr:hypothetical protein [Betaproteobacteria bacterium]